MTPLQTVLPFIRSKRPIVETTIDGKPAVLVTVVDGSQAVLDPDSLLQLYADGLSLNWYVTQGANGHEYVAARKLGTRNTKVRIGRAIMSPPEGYAVKYHGGTFDLRKESLEVVPKEHLTAHARQAPAFKRHATAVKAAKALASKDAAGVIRTASKGEATRREVRTSPHVA